MATEIKKSFLDKPGVQEIFSIILENNYTKAEINALLAAIEESIPSLTGYATEEWVGKQGFLTEDDLEGYATESWVEDQEYLTEDDLEGYATESWVEGKKYLTEHQSLEEYAKKSELPDVTGYPDKAEYDEESKKIVFKHGETALRGMEIDATDFIKDGMVNEVKIADGTGTNNGKKVLLITFNTDAGKSNIEIPLENIFNASNYYNKEEVDEMFEGITALTTAEIQAAYAAAVASKS